MGINLFVEGSPAPVVVRVTLPQEVHTFHDITHIARSLRDVDNILRSTWSGIWPNYGNRRNRDVSVLHFHVDSPPSFEILSDPAWLAVFLIAITGYKQGKESAREIVNDLSSIVYGIKGLTTREVKLLEIAVTLGLERILSLGERESLKIAKVFARARQWLIGDSETNPRIEVKDVDNKSRSW